MAEDKTKKLHHKPTPEELDAGIQASLNALEDLDKPNDPPTDPKPEPQPDPIDPKPDPEPQPDTKPEPEIKPDIVLEKTPEELEAELVEKNKKLSASAREAQKIYAKNRKLNEGILEAGDIPEPTDEEMTKEFSEWENMGDFEKKLAKDNTLNRKRLETIHKAAKEGEKIDKWNETVDQYVSDPKNLIDNPDLEGKEAEFKSFASDPKFNSAPFSLLVPAFLHQTKLNTPIKKGSMFETGNGGPKDKPTVKNDILTVEEGRNLMLTDYNKWKELLKAGKIADE